MMDWNRVKGYVIGLIACAIISLLTGCRTTRYVPVESVRTEYKDRVRIVHDTVRDSVRTHNFEFRKDSMAIAREGDTVFVDRWHTVSLVRWEAGKTSRSNTVHDTLTAVKTDSVRVPYPVERELTKWEQVKMDFGGVAMMIGIIGLLGIIGYTVWWLRMKIKKK